MYSTISPSWNTDMILKTVRASCTIPLSFHPMNLFPSFWNDSLHYLDEEGVCIDGTYYVDGGIASPAPTVPSLKSGSKSIVISPISYAGTSSSNLDENTYRISPIIFVWKGQESEYSFTPILSLLLYRKEDKDQTGLKTGTMQGYQALFACILCFNMLQKVTGPTYGRVFHSQCPSWLYFLLFYFCAVSTVVYSTQYLQIKWMIARFTRDKLFIYSILQSIHDIHERCSIHQNKIITSLLILWFVLDTHPPADCSSVPMEDASISSSFSFVLRLSSFSLLLHFFLLVLH